MAVVDAQRTADGATRLTLNRPDKANALNDDMVAALRARGIALSHNVLAEIRLKQIFLKDPNGLSIELNFRE